jgi:starch synthase
MKILYATSEATPYFKTGGLADVSRALPDALLGAGHDVRIITPMYGSARAVLDSGVTADAGRVPWPEGPVDVRFVHHQPARGAPAVLVERPDAFESGSPYDGVTHDPLETGLRFAFFCRAIVRYALDWRPDVIHLNDWTTGFVPVYALADGLDTATVFAIHNLAYQGNFPTSILEQAGVPTELFRTENGIEFQHMVSFMKAGLALSDRIVTVSPTYAREIQTPAYGEGFDGLLRYRRRVLTGILNGIDTEVWDPANDTRLPATYSAKDISGKTDCREALLTETRLNGWGPIFSFVGRLVQQKGPDLILAALPSLLESGARIVVLGDGERRYQLEFQRAARAVPDRIAFFNRFDDGLARRIYAGSDFFLMPSRYEPCGLGQMIAQRYGTPPVARHTGGLVDTVTDRRTGFLFDDPAPEAVAFAARRAASMWNVKGWPTFIRRCMRLDWSWNRSAQLYETVYRAATGAIDSTDPPG